jgi:hypothetical protein
MPEPPDDDLERHHHRFRGAFILRPASPSPPRSRRQRITAFFKRTRVLVAAAVAALLTAVGLLNASLDLWGRTRGPEPSPSGTVDIGYQTFPPELANRALWRDGGTGCVEPIFGEQLHLFQEPYPSFDPEPGEGEIGVGNELDQVFSTANLVHPEVIDVDPNGFDRAAFLARGAYVAGNQAVSVILANRTAEQLVVTDMTLEVERHPPPSGTSMYFPGGDPRELNIIVFDLQEENPVARVVGDDCSPGAPFFAQYAFVVDAGDTELFRVELIPTDCLCLVRLHIHYWHRGQRQTLTLPEEPSERFPVTDNHSQRYQMLYVDNTADITGGRMEKYDCRTQDHELCEPID